MRRIIFFDCDETLWTSPTRDYISSINSDFELIGKNQVLRKKDGLVFTLRPGIRRLFAKLKSEEITIGIVSDNRRRPVINILELFGLVTSINFKAVYIKLWKGYCPKHKMIQKVLKRSIFKNISRRDVLWVDDKDYTREAKKIGVNFINVGRADNFYNNYKFYMETKVGGYKSLPFFNQSEIIYDFTAEFVKLYIDQKSRTKDQMVQAARSGKQNIAEGYLQKSLEGRLKLLSVARGSLEELLNDYQDFLRQNKLSLWEASSAKARQVRDLVYKNYKSYNDYKIYISGSEGAANAMICLINQTNQLLDQKLRWTEDKFVKEGGFRENLFKKRLGFRKKP